MGARWLRRWTWVLRADGPRGVLVVPPQRQEHRCDPHGTPQRDPSAWARRGLLSPAVPPRSRRVEATSRVRPGDVVAVADKAKEMLVIKSALVSNERMQVPAWLEVDIEKLQGNVLSLPNRDQIDLDINEQLIVELYSK